MAKRRFDDIQLSKKYRCCFGYLHVKTATQILCAVLVVNSGLEIKNFILEEKYEIFEIIKILYGISSAFGPVIGIEMENQKFFFPFFFGPVYSLILILLYVICPTKFGRRMDEVLNKFNSKSRVFSIFIFFIALFFIFQIWIYSVLYKCYKYISAISLQAKHEQAMALKKMHKRGSNYYLHKSNNMQKLAINTTSTLVQKIKKNVECLFGKKKIPSEAKELTHKTNAAKNVEDKFESFKPETPESKQIQKQKVSTQIEKSIPTKCELNVQLKNCTFQSERVEFTVKLKSSEAAEKIIKLPTLEKQNILNSMPAVSESYLQRESEFYANQEQYSLISTPTNFEYYNLHNYPDKSKPIKLVSSEVQTNETSFDQTIIKNYNQCQNNTYFEDCSDSDTYSNNSPKEDSFTPNSTSDANFLFYQTSSLSRESFTKITFLFKNDETCAVESYQNGRKKLLKNSFDNEWTPLYFSMARSKFEIGEKAQIHYHQFPEYVLYDIFKIIGKSMNKIEYNPEWKFKIVQQNGMKYFQIKTPDGSRLYPEESIIAAFLKSLKVQAENYLNTEIHEIHLSTNFELTDSQKNVFKNAASKICLKILSFSVTEI